MGTNHHNEPAPRARREDLYERTDTDQNSGDILIFGAAMISVVAITAAVMWVYVRHRFDVDSKVKPASGITFAPESYEPVPEPRLQLSPRADMARYREEQKAILSSYGWVSKENGIARIPIQRAIEVVAAKGLPQRSLEESATFFDQATSAPQDGSSGRTYRNRLR